jgi:predicted GNAT family acetyltransferase
MSEHEPEIRVVNNVEASRYEILVDGTRVGLIEYVEKPGRVAMTHAEVDPSVEGRGIGSLLASGALQDVRARGLSVVPACPFVKSYVETHPEYQDLVYRASSSSR